VRSWDFHENGPRLWRRHRRYPVVSWGRCVAPEWPRQTEHLLWCPVYTADANLTKRSSFVALAAWIESATVLNSLQPMGQNKKSYLELHSFLFTKNTSRISKLLYRWQVYSSIVLLILSNVRKSDKEKRRKEYCDVDDVATSKRWIFAEMRNF